MLPDIPLFGSSAPAAVRRPVFEIAFGAPGGGDGGLGGLASAAASAIGLSAGGEDPWKRAVARVTIECGVAQEVDRAEITLATDAHAPPVALGDEGTIKLGYEDEGATIVYSGRIESIRRDARGSVRITVANASATLAAFRLHQSFENQTAGDIVSELASQADVTTGNIADGSDFAFHFIDDTRSAWQHIARLARVNGFLALITPENELDFRAPAAGEPLQTFTWGVDILALHRREAEAAFDAVTVAGEGAAGSDGAEAWNWLTKDPAAVSASAGSGQRSRVVIDRALRSADAVQTAAQALVDAAARAALTGTLQVPGAPAVVPGAHVKVADTPGGTMDGELLVMRVRHTFDKRAGFRSRIEFAGSSGGGGGSLGGLL